MQKLKLTNGGHSFVDESTYALVNQWKWYKSKTDRVIRTTPGQGSKILLHRLLLNFPKNQDIDHINGNPLDNRLSNLRLCSHKENMRNSKKYKNNTSGYKGVSWSKSNKKWGATIWLENKKKFLGYFENAADASHSYNEAASKYFGEFARINQI
jgi:hypothetical protein